MCGGTGETPTARVAGGHLAPQECGASRPKDERDDKSIAREKTGADLVETCFERQVSNDIRGVLLVPSVLDQ